jgi:hypothetical protein
VRTIKHPLSGALYDLTERGTIEVTKGAETGEFTAHGVWLTGEIRHADPHLCLWIGGKQLPNRFQQAAAAVKAATDSPTAAPAADSD